MGEGAGSVVELSILGVQDTPQIPLPSGQINSFNIFSCITIEEASLGVMTLSFLISLLEMQL